MAEPVGMRRYSASCTSPKGLEFRAVVLIACDEGNLPLESRVADVAYEFELDEVIATERQLFYVAATRERAAVCVGHRTWF